MNKNIVLPELSEGLIVFHRHMYKLHHLWLPH